MQPRIFAIKRASLDDGNGIRTVFFLKGCPLRCSWCHNPESQTTQAHIELDPSRCLGCGRCRAACPTGALTALPGITAAACRRCGICAEECISGALRRVGEYLDIAELCAIAREDTPYYVASGGGVTFSGGEPLLHARYVGLAAARLREEGIGVAVQTCGQFAYAAFHQYVAPHIDTVYFDVKLADPQEHLRYTGRDNRRILENLARLVASGIRVVPRTPCIPGVTDTRENLAGIAALLEQHGLQEAHVLLPHNALQKRAFVRLI